MSLSKLSEKCKKCQYIDICDNKRMEACGYIQLPEIEQPITVDVTAPVLRDIETINKEILEKQLYGHLYSHLNLQYGG